MMLTNFVKSIIPYSFGLVGTAFSVLSKIFEGLATIFFNLAATLHMLFNTRQGRQLKELEKATQSILAMYGNIAKKIEAQKTAISEEDNRLAKIIKQNKNIVKLGKNDNEDTDN